MAEITDNLSLLKKEGSSLYKDGQFPNCELQEVRKAALPNHIYPINLTFGGGRNTIFIHLTKEELMRIFEGVIDDVC